MSKDRPVRRPTEEQALSQVMRDERYQEDRLIREARRERDFENRRLEDAARRIFGR